MTTLQRKSGREPSLVGPQVRELRRSAVLAGSALLVMAVVAGAADVVVLQGLVTKGDAAATARDVAASAGLFRLGIVAFVVVVGLDVLVAWALRTFFAPVDAALSALGAWLRLAYAAIFAAAVGQLVGVVPLVTGATSSVAGRMGAQQREVEALLRIETFQDVWQVALSVFGLHLLVIGWLAYRSGYVPRVLGVLLVVAGVGYVVDSVVHVLVGDVPVAVSSVTFVGEALLFVWLLVKGRRVTVAISNLPGAWSGNLS